MLVSLWWMSVCYVVNFLPSYFHRVCMYVCMYVCLANSSQMELNSRKINSVKKQHVAALANPATPQYDRLLAWYCWCSVYCCTLVWCKWLKVVPLCGPMHPLGCGLNQGLGQAVVWWNPWLPLTEPLGSAEPRLKSTAIHRTQYT